MANIHEEYQKIADIFTLKEEDIKTFNWYDSKNMILSKNLIKNLGVKNTIVLTPLITYNQNKKSKYFYTPLEELTIENALSKKEVLRILKKLEQQKLISIVSKGTPPKMYFCVNMSKVEKIL
jgi:uncharacterized protein YjbK